MTAYEQGYKDALEKVASINPIVSGVAGLGVGALAGAGIRGSIAKKRKDGLVDEFKEFNQLENQALAQHYFAAGAQAMAKKMGE